MRTPLQRNAPLGVPRSSPKGGPYLSWLRTGKQPKPELVENGKAAPTSPRTSCQPAPRPLAQSILDGSANQPTNLTTIQSTNQPTNQSTNRSINQAIKQPTERHGGGFAAGCWVLRFVELLPITNSLRIAPPRSRHSAFANYTRLNCMRKLFFH